MFNDSEHENLNLAILTCSGLAKLKLSMEPKSFFNKLTERKAKKCYCFYLTISSMTEFRKLLADMEDTKKIRISHAVQELIDDFLEKNKSKKNS